MTDISNTYVEQLRQEGNELFKSELFEGAIEKYSLALNSMGTETNVKGRNQKAILLSNRAACHIALERWTDAIKDCRASLSFDPKFSKTYLRLGRALEKNNDPVGALQSYARAIHLSLPENGGNQGRVDRNVFMEVEQLQRSTFGKVDRTAKWRKLRVSGKPPSTSKGSAVEWRGQIFLFGGIMVSTRQTTNKVHIFDTHTMEWRNPTTVGQSPAPRSGHKAFIFRDSMYICGGSHSPDFDMWRLNLSTLRWTSVPFQGDLGNCPPGIMQHNVCLVGEKLLVWGGRVIRARSELDQERHAENLFTYNLRSSEWQCQVWSGGYMPAGVMDRGVLSLTEKYANFSANVEGESKVVYAFFGSQRSGNVEETVEAIDRLSLEDQRWESIPILGSETPTSRAEVATLYLPEYQASVVWGGFLEGAKNMDAIFFDECWVFHHNLGIWTKLKNAGEKVSAASHCWMFQRSDGKIFVGGGYRSHQAPEANSDVYELTVPKLNIFATSSRKNEIAATSPRSREVKPKSPPISPSSPMVGNTDDPINEPIISPIMNRRKSVRDTPSPPTREAPRPSNERTGRKPKVSQNSEVPWVGRLVKGTEKSKPKGSIHWQLDQEKPWEVENEGFNLMLAKLQYSSRQSMNLKTPQEARAGLQPQQLKLRNQMTGREVAHALELHIRLRHIQPAIWRRIQVPGNMPLSKFHDQVLCPSIGWSRNLHAYKIRANDAESANLSWYGPVHSKAPDMMVVKLTGEGLADDSKVMVGELIFEAGDTMAYIYDLKRCWDHEITVIKRIPPPPGKPFASVEILDGWGACPPENAGGVSKYIRQLAILSEPHHLEHKSTLALFLEASNKQTSFVDPCEFDVEEAKLAVEEAMVPGSRKVKPKVVEPEQVLNKSTKASKEVVPVGQGKLLPEPRVDQSQPSNNWAIVPSDQKDMGRYNHVNSSGYGDQYNKGNNGGFGQPQGKQLGQSQAVMLDQTPISHVSYYFSQLPDPYSQPYVLEPIGEPSYFYPQEKFSYEPTRNKDEYFYQTQNSGQYPKSGKNGRPVAKVFY